MFQYVERSKMSSQSRTMSLTLLLVLVSVVAGDGNSTAAGGGGGSRMAWMKGLLDHHDWAALLDNSSLPAACAADLRVYLRALSEGQAWASKSESPLPLFIHIINLELWILKNLYPKL